MLEKFYPWQGGVYHLTFSTHRAVGWYYETRRATKSFGPYETQAQAERHIKPAPVEPPITNRQRKFWADIERKIKQQRRISNENYWRRNAGIYLDEENFTLIPKTGNSTEFKKVCIDLDIYRAAQENHKGLLEIEEFLQMHPEAIIEKKPHRKRINVA